MGNIKKRVMSLALVVVLILMMSGSAVYAASISVLYFDSFEERWPDYNSSSTRAVDTVAMDGETSVYQGTDSGAFRRMSMVMPVGINEVLKPRDVVDFEVWVYLQEYPNKPFSTTGINLILFNETYTIPENEIERVTLTSTSIEHKKNNDIQTEMLPEGYNILNNWNCLRIEDFTIPADVQNIEIQLLANGLKGEVYYDAFKISKPALSITGGFLSERIEPNVPVNAEIDILTDDDSDHSAMALMGLYDENNSMKALTFDGNTVNNSFETLNLNILNDNQTVDGYSARLYLVDGDSFNSTTLTPIINTQQIGSESAINRVEDSQGAVGSSGIAAKATIDYETGDVEIVGSVLEGETEKMSVISLHPDYAEQLNNITLDNIDEAIDYFDVVNLEQNNFKLKYRIKPNNMSVDNEMFKILLVGEQYGQHGEILVKNYNSSSILKTINAVKTATNDEIEDMLRDTEPVLIDGTISLSEILQLDLSEYRTLTDKQIVCSEIAGKDFSTGGIKMLKQAFETGIVKQKEDEVRKQRIAELVNSIQQASEATDISVIFNNYNDILQLPLDDYGYTYLLNLNNEGNAVPLNSFYEKFIGSDSVSSIVERFNLNTPLFALNFVKTEKIGEVLNNYASVFGDSLVAKFEGLHNDDRAKVMQILKNKCPFSDKSSVGIAIQNAINSITPVESTTSHGSAGGGGTYRFDTSISTGNKNQISQNEEVIERKELVDINDVEWAKTSILALLDRNIVSGNQYNQFNPNDNITREEFIKMLVLALNLYDEEAETNFIDADESAWYYKYIASAQAKGVVNGVTATRFGVGEKITRQDMAVMIDRAVKIVKLDLPVKNEIVTYNDESLIAGYAKESVSKMSQVGLINGVGDGIFAPTDFSTKAMVAKVIYGLINKG